MHDLWKRMRFAQISACGILRLVAGKLDPRSRVGDASHTSMVPNVVVEGAPGILNSHPSFTGRTFQPYVLFFGRYSNSGPNSFGSGLKKRCCFIVLFFQPGPFFAYRLKMLRYRIAGFHTRWLDLWLAKLITKNQ